MVAASRYSQCRASLATMHDKLPLVAPAMKQSIDLHVFAVDIDTDAFGTFAGEHPRMDSPLVTAERKAREGMHASGSILGLATEGSIGGTGFLPLVVDRELVVFVDDEQGFMVSESAIGHDIIAVSWTLDNGFPDAEQLERADFPHHGLIVRSGNDPSHVFKGIHDEETLRSAITSCRADGATQVTIETDLRANHCPSRRPTIAEAASRLAKRLARPCSRCGCPGWGPVDVVRGRKCASCRFPTDGIIATVNGCAQCSHRETVDVNEQPADPATCDMCNP